MSVIFVYAPAQVHSGGPELLHQLCCKLRLYGYDSRMVYYDRTGGSNKGSVVHVNYRRYRNPVAESPVDETGNIVVVPEVRPDLLKEVRRAVPVLWWLSVDNFFHAGGGIPIEELARLPRLLHFVQSEYARDYVQNTLKVPAGEIFYLADYLRDDYFKNPFLSLSADRRLPLLLFNPIKGSAFTQKLFALYSQVRNTTPCSWTPLWGFSPGQLSEIMQKAYLYIDFGNHPGMDRIPREAAASGCCVITGRKGSAGYHEDVPIPEEYKFADEESTGNFAAIISKISDIMGCYNRHIPEFEPYRRFIAGQESRFEKDMLAAFTPLAGPPVKTPQQPAGQIETVYESATALYNTIGEALKYTASCCMTGRYGDGLQTAGVINDALASLSGSNGQMARHLKQMAEKGDDASL